MSFFKRKIVLRIFACVLVAVMSIFGLFVAGEFVQTAYAVDDVEIPESLQQGLSRKSQEEIQGKRVTLRQPQMQVLRRGLPRKAPSVLGDTFVLPNSETGENSNASITFPFYPSMTWKTGDPVLSNFQKYMLLRQVQYLNQNALADAEAGRLGKHPAADGQYGEIPVENNAVEKRIVTDPIYRSPMTTGLYLAPGEIVTVKVSGLKKGESLSLFTHHQQTLGWADGNVNNFLKNNDAKIIEESKKAEPDYEGLGITLHSQYVRQNSEIPAIGATFNLTENRTYKIGCPFGGPLYLNPTNSPVELVITGAIEMPHFILGVTSKEEFESFLRNAPGPLAVLDCENGQLIGPSESVRKTDDIEKLAYLWHSIFTINSSFNGRAYNYDVTLSFDRHVPAGSAVALSATRAAMPTGWFDTCMNYEKLTTNGQWGTLHELGHIHANAYNVVWGMRDHGGKEGEVRNNTLIILAYTMLCNLDYVNNRGIEHGEFSNAYYTLLHSINMNKNNNFSDYDEFGYFEMLSLYSNLIHAFSPEKFVDFLYTYSMNKSYCENSRADFVYRIAMVNKVNILNWLNESYHANILNSDFSSEQFSFLNSLPVFYPIASVYANGVNETETSAKYTVDFKHPTTFDFSGDNIICPKEFVIVGFNDAQFGKISVSNSKVTYTPPTSLMESDEFSVVVKIIQTQQEVVLPIRLRFSYNGSYSQVWDDLSTRNLDEAIAYSQNHPYSYTEIKNVPGKASWTKVGVTSYVNSKFRFVASQSGVHKFFLKSDDIGRVEFLKDGTKLAELSNSTYTGSYQINKFVEISLQKGEDLGVNCDLLNTGGPGMLFVGVKMPEAENIVDIPATNILSFDFDLDDLPKIESFKWQPRFLDSIKDCAAVTRAKKDGWEILEFPNPHPNDAADPQRMVDGDDSTIFHSKYNGGESPMPHVIVLDTKSENYFNYFEIVTRGNVNSKIIKMDLFGSTDNQNWNLLCSTEDLKYENLHAYLDFETTKIRYFKMNIRQTSGTQASGKYFTVIGELYAGIKTNVEQTIKPSNVSKQNKGFVSGANGELSAQSKNSTYVFEFDGMGFDIFANTAPDYGTAKVFVDDEVVDTISLKDDFSINSLVFSIKNLQNKHHVVKIETLEDRVFHIGYLNVDYGAKVSEESGKQNDWMWLVIILSVSCAVLILIILILLILLKKKKNKNKKKDVARRVKKSKKQQTKTVAKISPVQQTYAKTSKPSQNNMAKQPSISKPASTVKPATKPASLNVRSSSPTPPTRVQPKETSKTSIKPVQTSKVDPKPHAVRRTLQNTTTKTTFVVRPVKSTSDLKNKK